MIFCAKNNIPEQFFLTQPGSITIFNAKIREQKEKYQSSKKLYLEYAEKVIKEKMFNPNYPPFTPFELKKLLYKLEYENAEKEEKKWQNLKKRAVYNQLSNEERARHAQNTKTIDLEAIKQIPIENLMPLTSKTNARTSQNRIMALCPFHNEKTNSFVIYKDTNTFYCFGACGKGGDNIKFIQLLNNMTFLDACNYLKTFI